MEGYELFKSKYRDRKSGQIKESRTWWAEFYDHVGARRRWKLCSHERTARRTAERILDLVKAKLNDQPPGDALIHWLESDEQPLANLRSNMVQAGLIERGSPIDEDLAAFGDFLKTKGTSEDHIAQTKGRIELVFRAVGIQTWRDVMAKGAIGSIRKFLMRLRADGSAVEPLIGTPGISADQQGKRRPRKKNSAATGNAYVKALRQFGGYMVQESGATSSPLDRLAVDCNAGTEGRQRRALEVEEMNWLLECASGDWSVRDRRHRVKATFTAADRSLLYRFAFETGMRTNQIRRLTPASFNLADEPPTVTSAARTVKRRREQTQVLKPSTAAILERRFETLMPTWPAFNMPDKFTCAEMLRHDLATARLKWIDSAAGDEERSRRQKSDFLASVNIRGETVDFYSLRHTHGTCLADAGVHQKDIAASLHHTKTSTTDRYVHTGLIAQARAINLLPPIARDEFSILAPTGTGGATACQANALRDRCDGVPSRASRTPDDMQKNEPQRARRGSNPQPPDRQSGTLTN
jgi:integrase